MKRRGFLKKFGIGVAAASVAPSIIPQIVEKITPTATKSYISADKFISVQYGGRTFHYYKGMVDAMQKHRQEIEFALLLGKRKKRLTEFNYAIPQGNGIIKYIK